MVGHPSKITYLYIEFLIEQNIFGLALQSEYFDIAVHQVSHMEVVDPLQGLVKKFVHLCDGWSNSF